MFFSSSVQFSHSVLPDTLQLNGLLHASLLCPSPTPGAYSNSCPFRWWFHPTISSSVIPFFSHIQSTPASGSFQMSQFFTSGGQSIGVSALASVLPMNIQDWSPLGWTGWISLMSKGLSRVFSNITVQKHKFCSTYIFFHHRGLECKSKKSKGVGSGSKELTLRAALIDSQGSVHGHSSLSHHHSGVYYPR